MPKIHSNLPTPVPTVATTPRRSGTSSVDTVKSGSEVGGVQSTLLTSGSSPTRAPATTNAPVDSARVEQLRAAVLNGSYKVDAGKIATSLVGLEKKLP